MASDPIKSLLDQALASLSENRPQEAIEFLDRIGPAGDTSPDQLTYRGLANAKLGNGTEATRLLTRAVELAPGQSRQNFTLAVHLRGMGDTEEARKYAEKARLLDPKFPGIDALLSSLGLEAHRDPRLRLRERLASPLPRPPEGPIHAFPSLEQTEKLWTTCGWVLVGLSFLGPLLFRLHTPYHLPAGGEQRGLAIFGGAILNADPLSMASIFLFVSMFILCPAWTITDMLDRRARVLWIIPMVPFCCLGAMPGIAQALYMGLGRKQ